MNWKLLEKLIPMGVRIIREIADGITNKRSPEEIRQRVASPDVILDDEIEELRDAEDDLRRFIDQG